MGKNLKILLGLAKAGKIVSLVIFILCVIGVAGCLVGMAALALGRALSLEIGGVKIEGILAYAAHTSVGGMLAALVTGLTVTAAEAVLAKFAEVYFCHVLAAGTPCTPAGVRELRRLGILAIALPLGSDMLVAVAHLVLELLLEDVPALEAEAPATAMVGVMLVILSLAFGHALELKEGADG